jgi:hypothetical protein
MTMQPATPEQVLFTPGPRLGWTFRDRRDLISRYPEPAPDAEAISREAAQRLAGARRSWRWSATWVLRPSLFVMIALLALGGCAHAFNPRVPFAAIAIAAVILAAPGTGWALWRLARLHMARTAGPRRQYEIARAGWEARATAWEGGQLERLAGIPEWGSAASPSRHTDVFGGTLEGWRSLLTVHGASILAERPLLVADLTGQYPAGGLAATARSAGVQVAEYLLPRDLGASGLLAMLPPRHLADALTEAIHAGTPPAARADRALDVRVLDQLASALDGHGVTPARLAAAIQAALGRPVPPGLLSEQETDLISGRLFGDRYLSQIGASLVRLDAFVADLASYAGTGSGVIPPPAWCTLLVTEPAARGGRGELIPALVIQWLTVQITATSGGHVPAVIIAGADEITGHHIERLADACDQHGVPLTVLFRHLRNDASQLIGGTPATAFMRLGNHREAEQAASFIGRHHKFVLSGYTATQGGEHTTTRGTSQSWGNSETRGFNSHRGWTSDGPFSSGSSGGTGKSRDYSRNYTYGTEESESDGINWNDATSTSRVYEYAVEPAVLQTLPGNALLLVNRTASSGLRSVECDPAIVTLPDVSISPFSPVTPSAVGGPPATVAAEPHELPPSRYQAPWPDPPADGQPAWQPPGDEPWWKRRR